MGIRKITYWTGFIFLFISCNNFVSKQEYNDVVKEYKELKKTVEESSAMNLNQAKTLTKTLSDLAEVSGNTQILRNNIENSTASITQAEKISNNIKAIKSRINELERIANTDEFAKTIKNLKIVIREKEKEINLLKEIISSQKEAIKNKQQTIEEQESTINDQQNKIHQTNQALNQALNEAIKKQAALLYKAGCEFEAIADNPPEVTKSKNKKKLEAYILLMYSKSLMFFEQSKFYGYSAAEAKINSVNKKYRALEYH